MPMTDYIDVRVLAYDQLLQEYPDPNGDSDGERSRVRYIESEVGQQFAVRIRLLRNFPLKHAPWFYASFQIDGETIWLHDQVSQEGLELYQRNGYLHTDIVLSELRSILVWNDAAGVWARCAIEFGALGTITPLKHTPEAVSKIGSIRVMVFRARRQRRDKPYLWNGAAPRTLDSLPEHVLKGRDIKTNTKVVPIRPADRNDVPPAQYFDFVPVKGASGKPDEFTFLYRTRKALQNIGCIPRSPSPEPDPRLVMQRQENMIESYKRKQRQNDQELERLRNELARSKSRSRTTSVVTDAEDRTIRADSAFPTVKREGQIYRPLPPLFNGSSSRPQKRTPDYFEGDGGELAEVAPPPKKPMVVIGLTDN